MNKKGIIIVLMLIFIGWAVYSFMGFGVAGQVKGNGDIFDARENVVYHISVKARSFVDKPAGGKLAIKATGDNAPFGELVCAVKYAQIDGKSASLGADCSQSTDIGPWIYVTIKDGATDTIGWSRTSDKTAIIAQVNKAAGVAKNFTLKKGDFRFK